VVARNDDHLLPLKAFVLQPHDRSAIMDAARQVLDTGCEMSYEPLLDLTMDASGGSPLFFRRIIPAFLFHRKLASARAAISSTIRVLGGRIRDKPDSRLADVVILLQMMSFAAHLQLADDVSFGSDIIDDAVRRHGADDAEYRLYWQLICVQRDLIIGNRHRAAMVMRELFDFSSRVLPTRLAELFEKVTANPTYDNDARVLIGLVDFFDCYGGCLLMANRLAEASRVFSFLADSIPRPVDRSTSDPPRIRTLLRQIDVLEMLATISGDAADQFDSADGVDAVISLPLWGSEHIDFFHNQVLEFWRPALERAGGRLLLHIFTRAVDEEAVAACLDQLVRQTAVKLLISHIPDEGLQVLDNYEILRTCHNASLILANRIGAAAFFMCADALIDRDFFRKTLRKFGGPTVAIAINSLAILSRDMNVVRQILSCPLVDGRLQMNFATFVKSISPQTLSYMTIMNGAVGQNVVPVETSHFLVLLKNRIMIFSPQLHVGALSARAIGQFRYMYGSSFDNGFVDRLCRLGLADRIYFVDDFSELRWLQLERNVVAEGWQGWGKAKPQAVSDFDMAAVGGMIRQSFQTAGRMLALQRPLELVFPGDIAGAAALQYRCKFERIAADMTRAFPSATRPLQDDQLLFQAVRGAHATNTNRQ